MSIQLHFVIIYVIFTIIINGKKLSELIFPKGTTFTVTVTTSAFMPEKDAKGFAQVIDLDFIYPLVEKITMKNPSPKTIWINPIYQFKIEKFKSDWHRRNRMIKDKQRKNLQRQLERAINLFGFNGKGCVLRFQCELNKYLNKPDTLIEDLLLILFKRRNLDCSGFDNFCPFSLLEIILNSQFMNYTLI